MSLEILINNDIKQAMLAKDTRKLEALRAIKAALLLEKTGKDISGGEIPAEVEVKTLQRLIKQRKEAANIYTEKGRQDLADEELYQLAIIEKYLPKQLSEAEIQTRVEEIISRLGASSIKDMGKVMEVAAKELSGQANNKTVSEIVKRLLVT
ncbi:MAG TPA: GatB/YqeY domain-containing protein [Bacteroidales bacterium]|jgi:hypothetical protein|nr:GatB/YqeY domain-containing protein [Bacteroidales bacterium]MDI9574701.1 GatB/YqeY domain-containing protein [Bacteroidota bacterium]OQC60848.1 MAG: Yqey-like protein [Bacteroidetes bacterium ADurb.Bin012]MBP9511129.1 GatB/YqeY domain-containing protein [Bacteroidales bacterium]MBP9588373.1 GatB/YqeY domain-containing protein [Bacteroidales bacterium]